VQVIKGRTSNTARVHELMASDNIDWTAIRPDIIASLSVDYGDGEYYTAIYFTSEAEARENEAKELPADMQAAMEEMTTLNEGEPDFLDIRDPWLYSPARA
jgi:hypothetical protein